MSFIARCKFQVSKVEQGYGQEIIALGTVYDENDPEDTKFSNATPWGNMEFGLSNPNLLGKFKEGDVFYLDLTPVEAP